MAEFEKTVVRTVRTEYRLRAPVHTSEVYKTMGVAEADVKFRMERFPRSPQPEIWVTSSDGYVVVYWEHEEAGVVTRGFADADDRRQP